jgi:hypothetical protein
MGGTATSGGTTAAHAENYRTARRRLEMAAHQGGGLGRVESPAPEWRLNLPHLHGDVTTLRKLHGTSELKSIV